MSVSPLEAGGRQHSGLAQAGSGCLGVGGGFHVSDGIDPDGAGGHGNDHGFSFTGAVAADVEAYHCMRPAKYLCGVALSAPREGRAGHFGAIADG